MGSIGPTPGHNGRLKTIDWGLNGVVISMDQHGTFLQIGYYHSSHGIVFLSPFEQFDGDRFYDPAYVRAYRARMLNYVKENKPGYGLQIHGIPSTNTDVSRDRGKIVLTYDTEDGIHVRRTTRLTGSREVQQTTELSTTFPDGASVAVTLELGMSLNRASYGQLTEGGPIPIPESLNVFNVKSNGNFSLQNPNLDASVEGHISNNLGNGHKFNLLEGEYRFIGEPVLAKTTAQFRILPEEPLIFTHTLHLNAHNSFTPQHQEYGTISALETWKLQDPAALMIIQGNLDYILGNCTIPVSEESCCIITDHVALPLGWNRDNYWQMRFLLEAFRKIDQITDPNTAESYREDIHRTVEGHLNWVFRDAQRPHGFWHRSYLATGVPKDGPVFQLDQQCYPIIQLCDVFDIIRGSGQFVRNVLRETTVPAIIQLITEKRHHELKLFPTDETPGDDPVEYPFHFSSHVLVWYTLNRLADLLRALDDTEQLHAAKMDILAKETHDAIMKHFVASNPKTHEMMFAYLTDGLGNHVFYHDANDIPTLFAQEWGFARTPESLAHWARTMKFGMSTECEGGYYGDGPFGGLGSVHTRGPWPLGYFQEYVFAEMQQDPLTQEDAWKKIKGVMFPDGLFSEAVDKQTGECTSKAWFSWPGSMIGAALLQDRSGRVLTQFNVKNKTSHFAGVQTT